MVSKLKALVAYLSYSGNTEEVAEIIIEQLAQEGWSVDQYRIDFDPLPDITKYDLILIGTFTWYEGRTPDEIKEFVLDIGYKPENIAVFGTGDTQFGGEEQFCQAVDRLVKFYESRWEGLKIEQSPRGAQEKIVINWIKGVVEDVNTFIKAGKNIRTAISE